MTHGRMEEAERELAKIEDAVRASGQELEPVDDSQALELVPEKRYGYVMFLGLVFRTYPKRAVLGATLMITQSFLYNAIYFTYGLVLVQFYGVSADKVPLYGLAFAVGNLCGPLLLGPLFDIVGRKPMISGTYIISGVLLAISGWLLRPGRPHRDNADVLLDRHLLLRLRRGERRLPHGQRDVADRDPCRGDRSLLRDRADLRSVRPSLLRCADRRRLQSDRALRRLRRRRSDHGARRDRRAPHRDQGGRQVARGRHETPDLGLGGACANRRDRPFGRADRDRRRGAARRDRRGRRRAAHVLGGRSGDPRRIRGRRDVHLGTGAGADPVAEPTAGRELRVQGTAPPASTDRARHADRDPRARSLGVVDGGSPGGEPGRHGARAPSAAGLPVLARAQHRVRALRRRSPCADNGDQPRPGALPVRSRGTSLPDGRNRNRRSGDPQRTGSDHAAGPTSAAFRSVPRTSSAPSTTSVGRDRSARRDSTTPSPISNEPRTVSRASSSAIRRRARASRSGSTRRIPT